MAITADEARDIADDLLGAANEINAFMDLNQTSREERAALRNAANALLRSSGSMTTTAVGLAIDEMQDESAALRDVIGQAKEKLETLESVAKAISIATALVDLASALLERNPGSIVNASRDLLDAATGDDV